MSPEVRTAGIASSVYDADDREIGHTLMGDYDDVDAAVVLGDAEHVEGPAVVVASSAGSYHVHGLRIRSWDETADDLRGLSASRMFVDEMIERGRAVLRTHAKLAEDEHEARPTPVPLRVIDDGRGPISRPHAIRLMQLADEAGRDEVVDDLAALVEDDRAEGATLSQEIWTYDDQGGEIA